MIVSLIVYSLLVGALVAFAARAVELVARWAGYPVRWIWAAAIVLTVALIVRAPFAPKAPVVQGTIMLSPTTSARAPVVPSAWQQLLTRAENTGRAALALPASVQHAAGRALPHLKNTYVGGLWAALTIALGGLFGWVHGRFHRARVRWPRAELHGVPVLVAPDAGPLVVGFRRPDVVVPEWLFDRAPAEQRLVVEHEMEHVRARDPMLLAIACVAAAMLPWNAALWYMLSRLRLAIELDCDARVLRRGATPALYGSLLVDVAERALPLRLSALALADDSHHLHQRILAMSSRLPKFALMRGVAATAIGCIALLSACEASMVTPVQATNDPATMQQTVKQLSRISPTDSSIHYWVDGIEVPAGAVKALAPSRIESIDVRKRLDKQSDVAIKLKGLPRKMDSSDVNAKTAGELLVRKTPAGPITFYLNGVKSDSAAVLRVSRDSIESVEIVKGAAAAALYGSDAGGGAIIVWTKGVKKPE